MSDIQVKFSRICILVVADYIWDMIVRMSNSLHQVLNSLDTVVRDCTGCTMLCGYALNSPCLQVETLQSINLLRFVVLYFWNPQHFDFNHNGLHSLRVLRCQIDWPILGIS